MIRREGITSPLARLFIVPASDRPAVAHAGRDEGSGFDIKYDSHAACTLITWKSE